MRLAEASPDPHCVLSQGERFWESLTREAQERWSRSEVALRQLALFFSASPGVSPFLTRHPEVAERLYLRGALREAGVSRLERENFLDQCRMSPGEEQLCRVLSHFRTVHLIRCYSQELLELHPLQEIWRDWSRVADLCIDAALVGCEHAVPHALKEVALCVLGMGKLGGLELNMASDIDLIFLYEAEEGPDPHAAQEAATLWTTKVVAALGKGTGDGLPFRVDLALRPAGKDGGLVQTPEAVELYHQMMGATWERMALIKARPVAGKKSVGHRCLKSLEPLVFRRYLDYGCLQDIRYLKERMEREIQSRPAHPVDVKMGRGGIREVEFFIQTLQIIYGGKMPQLRTQGTIGAICALKEAGILRREEASSLKDSYMFLRRVEHRLQMIHHSHVHRLPQDPSDLEKIARLMGFEGSSARDAFMEALEGNMEIVHRAFEGLLEDPDKKRSRVSMAQSKEERIISLLRQGKPCESLLEEEGFHNPSMARESLSRILSPVFSVSRSQRARQILGRLLPSMIRLAGMTPSPDQTIMRLERFLESIGPRGGYFALLEENPHTLEYLVRLLGSSAMLSRWMAAHLEAVEGLLDSGHRRAKKGLEELRDELDMVLHGRTDVEERLGRLRAFRSQEIMRIGAGQLFGELGPMEVCEELTILAEAFLEATLKEVLRSLRLTDEEVPFCILALGSFGGRELSYHSDLDVLFLYDDHKTVSGSSSLEMLTKVGQRLISWISVPIKEGPGWPLDLRLRPSGSVGPLMVTLESFRIYHREQARLWERQSLLKARSCLGEQGLKKRAMDLMDEILREAPAPDPREIHSMRMRMEKERAGEISMEEVNTKVGPGGMVDVEFIVQYHQMTAWPNHPSVRSPNTLKVMEALVELGQLKVDEADFLTRFFIFLKGLEQNLELVLDQKVGERPLKRSEVHELAAVFASLSQKGAGGANGAALWSRLKREMRALRAMYLRHLCDDID